MQNTATCKSAVIPGAGRNVRGSAASPGAPGQQAHGPTCQGRLILVTSADSGHLDLVLQAVRRRLNGTHRLAFVEPVVTRLLPAGGGAPVSRSAFGALDRTGALALVWQRDGRSFGYSVSLLARLASGETVVAGAPLEAEARAKEIWADVRVIRLETGTEGLRSVLSPHACLSRMVGAKGQGQPLTRMQTERYDVRLRDGGDIGTNIRALASAVLLQQPPAPVAIQTDRKSRASASKPAIAATIRKRATRGLGAKRPPVPRSGRIAARADKPPVRVAPST